MLAQLSPKGNPPADMDTDHEQVSSDEDTGSDDELDTPFPILSDKNIHVLANGWGHMFLDDLDVIASLKSLELPLQSKLKPRMVNGPLWT
jgi:hypothetical protein